MKLLGFVYVQAQWPAVESAQLVIGGLLGSPGVRITLAAGRKFVFWYSRPDRVLSAMREHGVRIDDVQAKPPKVWLGT